jgi:RHS repeat-associated protein
MENGDYTIFTYDHSNQLTRSGFLASGSMSYVYHDYGYDAAGNRNTGGSTPTTGNQLSTDGTWDYVYDAKGNVTEKDSVSTAEKWTYAYNNANELTQAKHYDASSALVLTANYKYDIFGNRAEKSVIAGGTTTTRYAYDMWNPAKAGSLGTSGSDIWAVMNGSSSLTNRQLQGDGIDEHLAYVTSGGNAFWFLSDHLGSIRTVVDSTGAAVHSYSYDGFGNVTSVATPSMYAWTGRELDAETGLQYNRARYYDATTGRWISLDPMGFDAGDSNLYRYVNNRATCDVDPSGLQYPGIERVRITPGAGPGLTSSEARAAEKKMQGLGFFNAYDFFIYGLRAKEYTTTLEYTPLYDGRVPWWTPLKIPTTVASDYQRGCFGLVNVRMGTDIYSSSNYFFTNVNDAIAKAKAIGSRARIGAIQSKNIVTTLMPKDTQKAEGGGFYASRISSPDRDQSGNHATWFQTEQGKGFWEWLGPTGWGAQDFKTGAEQRYVTHTTRLAGGYKTNIYVVVPDPKTSFPAIANGVLSPTTP